ncbi:helix-turn-helix transcriptional regulator [Sphingomonas sp. PB4P5]|uniref:helix-turn-helix transcriptional regulator n=1 Tax=Parasphingomonas puruogangriensis TaxID=3096155 RepID=UPI002FCB28F5
MTTARFDRVTEPQRECLRLVLTRHNSKEIAQTLGVSPVTVDKRIGRAVGTLGVATRFEAARLLALHEGGTYQPLVYQPPDIVLPVDSAITGASEALAPTGDSDAAGAGWLPLRPRGGRYNTLTVWQRLLWIFTIPAALAVAVGMLGFGLSVVGKILQFVGVVVS